MEIPADKQQAFILRLAERLPAALKNNIVGVGWCEARKIDEAQDWSGFKNILREAFPERYSNTRALGNAAGSLWCFIKDMRINDLVAVPSTDGFYIAKITSDIIYDETGCEEDFAWRRTVQWLTRAPLPRSYAMNQLQRRLKVQQTCVNATDILNEILDASNRNTPISLSAELIEQTRTVVGKALRSAVNDRGLEDVIKKLAAAGGAKTTIPAKNSQFEGDADVMAQYDLKIANRETPVFVAYQVKQHDGTSDSYGIEQLIKRQASDERISYSCFVTTAADITPEAKEMADKNAIIVLTEKELVEWLLMAGLSILS